MSASAESAPRAIRPNQRRECGSTRSQMTKASSLPLAVLIRKITRDIEITLTRSEESSYEYKTFNAHVALWAVGALLAFRARAAGDGDDHRRSQRRQRLGRGDSHDAGDQRRDR